MSNRYLNTTRLRTSQGRRYYGTTRYPEVPRRNDDIYVISTDGDRYDTLAFQYYSDPSLWWIISICNSSYTQNSLIPPIGFQIRIPINPELVINQYNQLNNNE
jgi:hypothetical protein